MQSILHATRRDFYHVRFKGFCSHLTISEIFVILKWMSKKNKNKQIQKNFRHAIAAVNVLVFIFVCFNAALLLTGGWDDISIVVVVLLPLCSLISLGLAMVNVAKYKSEGRELVASIVALACSALLAGFVLIHPVVIQMIAG